MTRFLLPALFPYLQAIKKVLVLSYGKSNNIITSQEDFAKIIQARITQDNTNPTQVGAKLGTSRQSIMNFLRSSVKVNISLFLNICDLFDYIIHIENASDYLNDTSLSSQLLFDNLRVCDCSVVAVVKNCSFIISTPDDFLRMLNNPAVEPHAKELGIKLNSTVSMSQLFRITERLGGYIKLKFDEK